MIEFFWSIIITVSIPLLVYISISISSIKKEKDRNYAIGIVIVITIFLTSGFHFYIESKNYNKQKSGCEEIRSTIYEFEGKYTNASMTEEGNHAYERCMNKYGN